MVATTFSTDTPNLVTNLIEASNRRKEGKKKQKTALLFVPVTRRLVWADS